MLEIFRIAHYRHACDALSEGGSIWVETDEAGGGLLPHTGVLRVRDDGPGLAPEVRERIFEPFFTTKTEGKGSGLGLSSCYGIVARAGGRIDVETRLGEGTTFHVHLPTTDAEAVMPAEGARPKETTGHESILLVEDEVALARATAEGLSKLGYRVHLASSGNEAVEYLRRAATAPDLLVTDIVMANMGGVELAQHVGARFPGLPILFITGYGEHTLPAKLGTDAPEVLRKPFTPSQLAARIRSLLAIRSAARSAVAPARESDLDAPMPEVACEDGI